MLWMAPLLSVLIGWSVWKFGGLEAPASITLGIALWTALWWIFEAVPIPVASLLPLALLPLSSNCGAPPLLPTPLRCCPRVGLSQMCGAFLGNASLKVTQNVNLPML